MFFGLDSRRRRLLKAASPGAMRDYLAVPFAEPGTPYRDVEFLALDLETTGLDATRDEILSIGFVGLKGGCIRLETAEHYLVVPDRAIPEQSAVIHQITDDTAAQGQPLSRVLPLVLRRLAGRVLLGHHVRVEREFLDAACGRMYGTPLLVPQADTEALVRAWLQRSNQPLAEGGSRLYALRERYGLPRYKAHDALTDALATAELFCAFVAKAGLDHETPLKRFLVRQ